MDGWNTVSEDETQWKCDTIETGWKSDLNQFPFSFTSQFNPYHTHTHEGMDSFQLNVSELKCKWEDGDQIHKSLQVAESGVSVYGTHRFEFESQKRVFHSST